MTFEKFYNFKFEIIKSTNLLERVNITKLLETN